MLAAGCEAPSKVQEENCVLHQESEYRIERREHQEECKSRLVCVYVRATGVLTVMLVQVTYGDFAESPLETLSALSQEVILPVLSNPMNRSGWPDVVSKEVTENLHKFIANGMRTTIFEYYSTFKPINFSADTRLLLLT